MHRLFSLAGIALALVLLLGVTIASDAFLTARLDLTEGRVYTLSKGSRSVASKVAEPIRLTLFYTRKAGAQVPPIATHAQRVRETLKEFVRASKGKITLEEVDPEPFTDAEDRAVQAGLAAIPMGGGAEPIYLGLEGVNSTDGRQAIRYFDVSNEKFLEYELAKLIHSLDNPKKPVIALVTQLPMVGGFEMVGNRPQQRPSWQIHQQLSEFFDVKVVAPGEAQIPEGVSVVVVVHPKDLPESTVYAIDQYVLRGGRAVVFVDPHCEVDVPPDAMSNQFAAMMAPRASDMPQLLQAWGVELVPGMIAADLTNAQTVRAGSQSRPEAVRYPAWVALPPESFDQSDPVTGELSMVTMASAGALKKRDGTSLTITPLISTSATSMLLPVDSVKMMPDPKAIVGSFVSQDAPIWTAVRISGRPKTAFPGGPPPPPPPAEGEPVPPAPDSSKHVAEASGDVNIIVVADADMLYDALWVQEQRLGSLSLGFAKVADNADFAIGAIDNLGGSGDLIAIRARARLSRPFTRVQKIRDEAEVRYLTEQKALESKLEQAQQRIAELQRDQAPGTQAILSPEQRAEIDRFTQEYLATRKQLRELQRTMRQDIESLGLSLKFVNIGLIPIVVTMAAVALGFYRVRRRVARPAPTSAKGARP